MKPTPRLYSDHMITAVLALLSYALFFYGLVSIGLVGPDEPRRHIAVRLAFTDQRADEFLRTEARQLPTDAPGLIMIQTSGAAGSWRK